ncbi:hypothetical protein D0463_09870 [Bacillus sp. V59.32b]|nr:hypothetical protein D0463_09870 [Bacillus sp. V59.32b]
MKAAKAKLEAVVTKKTIIADEPVAYIKSIMMTVIVMMVMMKRLAAFDAKRIVKMTHKILLLTISIKLSSNTIISNHNDCSTGQ